LFLGGLGLQSGFNQIYEDAVGAGFAGFGDGADVLDDVSGNRNALADSFG
jgi:hypothetical protein